MQLPTSDIINAALRDVWQGRRDFFGLAFLPALVMAAMGTATTPLIGDPRIVVDNPEQVPTAVVGRMFLGLTINWLAGFAVYTMFAVAWHRRTLVGTEAITFGAAMRWGVRQWRYFGRLVLMVINIMVFLFVMSALLVNVLPVVPALSVLMITGSLIYARLSLVLPAAAIDQPMTFGAAVKLSAGNSWRMVLAVVVLPLVVMLIGGTIVLAFVAPLTEIIGSSLTAQFAVSLVAQSVNYIGFAVGITALSLAYRLLTAPASPAPPAELDS